MVEVLQKSEVGETFDLDWDDGHVVPAVIYPDLAFLFKQLETVALREVQAKAGEKVLDVGCGRATDAVELAKDSGKCIGLEPSEKMIGYAKSCIRDNGNSVCLVRGLGEYLPLKDASLNKVVCKGALDHFPHPELAIEEMARVLRSDGKAVIAVVNLESLSCRLGRTIFVRLRKMLRREESIYEKMWQTPIDHTYRFDHRTIRSLASEYMEVDRCVGISLLFGCPWWGMILSKMPQRVSSIILVMLDGLARRLPWISDVVLVRCSPKRKPSAAT